MDSCLTPSRVQTSDDGNARWRPAGGHGRGRLRSVAAWGSGVNEAAARALTW